VTPPRLQVLYEELPPTRGLDDPQVRILHPKCKAGGLRRGASDPLYPRANKNHPRGARLVTALYTILYKETFKPENAEHSALSRFNNLRRLNTLTDFESHPHRQVIDNKYSYYYWPIYSIPILLKLLS